MSSRMFHKRFWSRRRHYPQYCRKYDRQGTRSTSKSLWEPITLEGRLKVEQVCPDLCTSSSDQKDRSCRSLNQVQSIQWLHTLEEPCAFRGNGIQLDISYTRRHQSLSSIRRHMVPSEFRSCQCIPCLLGTKYTHLGRGPSTHHVNIGLAWLMVSCSGNPPCTRGMLLFLGEKQMYRLST